MKYINLLAILLVILAATAVNASADPASAAPSASSAAALRQHLDAEMRRFTYNQKSLLVQLQSAKTPEAKRQLLDQLKALAAAHHQDFEQTLAALKSARHS